MNLCNYGDKKLIKKNWYIERGRLGSKFGYWDDVIKMSGFCYFVVTQPLMGPLEWGWGWGKGVFNKHFMTSPKGNSEFCFPETLNVPRGELSTQK